MELWYVFNINILIENWKLYKTQLKFNLFNKQTTVFYVHRIKHDNTFLEPTKELPRLVNF